MTNESISGLTTNGIRITDLGKVNKLCNLCIRNKTCLIILNVRKMIMSVDQETHAFNDSINTWIPTMADHCKLFIPITVVSLEYRNK